MRPNPWINIALCGACLLRAASAQGDLAKTIYKQTQDSVYLIYTNDPNGKPIALGTGFQISPHEIITNAHVIEDGTPVVAVGPVRIPATVEKIDKKSDLAMLKVDVELTSRPLTIATGTMSPGETIFAIGNPEGLEKTISQGIVSGIRNEENHKYLQITAPLSHGSSGGPILNSSGEIAGVAVAILKEGQNLNFAIPSSVLTEFLSLKETSPITYDSKALFDAAQGLIKQRINDDYSSDQHSAYQAKTALINKNLRSAIENAKDSALLTNIACVSADEDTELSVTAARKAVTLQTDSNTRAVLAYTLYHQSFLFDLVKPNGETRASVGADVLAKEAIQVGKLAVGDPKLSPSLASYAVAEALEDEKDPANANLWFQKALNGKPTSCIDNILPETYRGIIRTGYTTGKTAQVESAFQNFVASGQATGSDWYLEGERLGELNHYTTSAIAYETAGSLRYTDSFCQAALNRYLEPNSDIDKLLFDGRACLSEGAKLTGTAQKKFSNSSASVNAFIAWALNIRGVYTEALSYAREAIAQQNDYAFAHHVMARSLFLLRRYQESISASKDAIRLSDGKFSNMHFTLGSAYFAIEDWADAQNAYQKAAELDPSNFEAAYNVALCYQRQGYSVDAVHWYKAALARNPSPTDRADIESAIARLSH